MGCAVKYIMLALAAITFGVALALIFPLSVIVAVQTVLVIILALVCFFKK